MPQAVLLSISDAPPAFIRHRRQAPVPLTPLRFTPVSSFWARNSISHSYNGSRPADVDAFAVDQHAVAVVEADDLNAALLLIGPARLLEAVKLLQKPAVMRQYLGVRQR